MLHSVSESYIFWWLSDLTCTLERSGLLGRVNKSPLCLSYTLFIFSPSFFPLFSHPVSAFHNLSSSSLCILEAENFFARQDPCTSKSFYFTSDSVWSPPGSVCRRTHTHLYVALITFLCLFIHSLSSLVLFLSILSGNICFIPPFPLLLSIQNNKQLGFPISLITFPGDFRLLEKPHFLFSFLLSFQRNHPFPPLVPAFSSSVLFRLWMIVSVHCFYAMKWIANATPAGRSIVWSCPK